MAGANENQRLIMINMVKIYPWKQDLMQIDFNNMQVKSKALCLRRKLYKNLSTILLHRHKIQE